MTTDEEIIKAIDEFIDFVRARHDILLGEISTDYDGNEEPEQTFIETNHVDLFKYIYEYLQERNK